MTALRMAALLLLAAAPWAWFAATAVAGITAP